MPIRLVVTRGFGNGTFAGDIGLVVTGGYGAGPEIIETPVGVDVFIPEHVKQKLKKLRQRAERAHKRELQERPRAKNARLSELRQIFAEINGEAVAPEAAAVVREAVAEFAEPSDSRIPPVQAIDFDRLLQSAEAVLRVAEAIEEAALIAEEDEAMTMIMLMVL